MENPESSKKRFDFSDIFPQCIEGYKWENHSPTDSLAHKLTPLCSTFYNSCGVGPDNRGFSQKCQLVTFYLHHIKSKKNEINVDACCKYFFYKLWDLLKKFRRNCGDTKNCYEKMKSLIISMNFKEDINELFSQCSNYPNNFDDNIFEIFKKVDIIYNALYDFKRKTYPNKSDLDTINREKKFLENSQNKYNESFTQLLKKFNETFITIVKELEEKKSQFGFGPFLQYIKTEEKTAGILKVIDIKTENDSSLQVYALSDTDTGTGISTGVAFSFFAILMSMLVLYKYTHLGSYLQPKERLLRKLINKKNKKLMNIISSYENMYNQSNEEQYEIEYRSI